MGLIPHYIILFCAVIEHAYQLGNAFQKQSLLLELYSAELQLFKDLVSMKERRYGVHFLSQYSALQKNELYSFKGTLFALLTLTCLIESTFLICMALT